MNKVGESVTEEEIRFVRKVVRFAGGRKIITIPKELEDKVEVGKHYLVILKKID